MNIGFDAKRLFLNNTGLGNYSRYILDTLTTYRPKDHFYLYTPKLKPNKRAEHYLGHPSIDIIQPPKIMQLPILNAWWRSSLMVKHESFSTLDIYHGLSHELPLNIPSNIKKFVTIHDLIFYRYPEFYSPIDVITYKHKVKSACARADKIMAISEQTANDIVHYLDIPEDKITVVYQGCHDQFRKSSTEEEKKSIKEKYHLPEKFILNVSTIEERKNTVGLIKAYAQIPSEYRIPLVIIGRATNYIKKVKSSIQQLGIEKDVVFIHTVEFSELPAIYQMAAVFVYPSLFEGFGIPLVEAAESQVPIITSTGSCFIEAAGPDAIYVDPLNANQLASAMTEVLSSNNAERIRKQKEYVKKFWPAETAKDITAFYES